MSLWNAANGPSIHAELVGREWVKMGHRLTVFSSIEHPDARPTNQVDEDYVIRHFSVDRVVPVTKAYFFDPTPLIETDYEVFVAENLERLPTLELYRSFPRIKSKSKTVMVVHEGGPSKDPFYYLFNWDAIVCFDDRYVDFIGNYFPRDEIHIIEYPCHPYTPGDKVGSRRELGFREDEKIVLSYGFHPETVLKVIPALEYLSKRYDLRYVMAVNPASNYEEVLGIARKYPFIDIRVSALPLETLYKYIYASDAVLFYRESSSYRAVLSSSVRLTLGAGRPILFNECNFVERHGDEIVKYRDVDDLRLKLVRIFEEGFDDSEVREFLRSRDSRVVAKKFIGLFEDLM